MLIGINDGISYYLCNIIENCVYYSNKSVCEKCLDDFYCLRMQYDKCVTLSLSKHYNDEITNFPCSDAVMYYDKCSIKDASFICINQLGTHLFLFGKN